MIYTASDAIDLAYRIIGKIAANYLIDNKTDSQHFRLMAMDLKELYRSSCKSKIKTTDEFARFFKEFQWTATNELDNAEQVQKKIYDFCTRVFFKKDDANYWTDRSHAAEELKKIYDIALEKTFIEDKTNIDWESSVRVIESRFLAFLASHGLMFNKDLKTKLNEWLTLLNESESANYDMKYQNAISAVKDANEFCRKYESDPELQKLINFQQEYETLSKVIKQFEKIYINNSRDISYDSLVKMINDLPDDASSISIKDGEDILKRAFYANYLYRHINSGKNALLNSKIAFISENGGWSIDLSKQDLYNTYIALTQSDEVIEREIKIESERFNDDISEVCLRLIALSLKDVAPEKFVNIEGNIEYEIPNKKIVSVFMYELAQLIKYHESGGQMSSNDFMGSGERPKNSEFDVMSHQSSVQGSSATSRANRLLDFENISGIITALKSGYRDIQDYPDTVVMRTIKYIAKLGEIEVI
jgi:hypothetical protein